MYAAFSQRLSWLWYRGSHLWKHKHLFFTWAGGGRLGWKGEGHLERQRYGHFQTGHNWWHDFSWFCAWNLLACGKAKHPSRAQAQSWNGKSMCWDQSKDDVRPFQGHSWSCSLGTMTVCPWGISRDFQRFQSQVPAWCPRGNLMKHRLWHKNLQRQYGVNQFDPEKLIANCTENHRIKLRDRSTARKHKPLLQSVPTEISSFEWETSVQYDLLILNMSTFKLMMRFF